MDEYGVIRHMLNLETVNTYEGTFELWFGPQIVRPPIMDYPVELSQWKDLSETTQRIIFVSYKRPAV